MDKLTKKFYYNRRYLNGQTSFLKKHSQKPEHVYNMIESMFPNTAKIELFARNIREGWDSWGNEVN